MTTKPEEKKPPEEKKRKEDIRYLGVEIPKERFKLSPRKIQRIRRIGIWLEKSIESLRHCIVGKPIDR